MLALLALAVLSPSPHDVGAPTATPDAIRPRVAKLRGWFNGWNLGLASVLEWATGGLGGAL